MQIVLRNFATLVESMAAAVQGSAAQLVDFTSGSVVRAIVEANAALALWMQWLILQVLQSTRLATSNGTDVDSFGADFGMARLAAVAAQGQATFSRFTPGMAALVPSGAIMTTADGVTRFAVSTDTANSAWNAAQGGYLVGVGVSSLTLPVAALVAGSAGNVVAGSLSLIATAVPGIDGVTNALALTGGLDAETDAGFRTRFQGFIDSRTRATVQAVIFAATSVQQGLSCVVQENTNGGGGFQPGQFLVTIDDGSGEPAAPLLALVQAAVDAVRPIGTIFAVRGPAVILAEIGVTLTLAVGTNSATAIANVAAAITAFVAALPVGASLGYTRLAQLAYDANTGVTNVTGLTLQGGNADLIAGPASVIRLGALAVG